MEKQLLHCVLFICLLLSIQKKLAEMETKSQILASEHQQSYLNRSQAKSSHFLDEAKSFLESTIDNDPGDKERKHRLKQQFRNRRIKR